MLFLGLGTDLGSALITDGVLVPMELAHLLYRKAGQRTTPACGAQTIGTKNGAGTSQIWSLRSAMHFKPTTWCSAVVTPRS